MNELSGNKIEFPRSKGGWIVGLVLCLIFLLVGILPSLFSLPGIQARFNGVETQAQVSIKVGDDDCSDDDGDDGSYFTYTFTDMQGQVQEITDNSTCSSGIVSAGDRVTIWYEPDNPVVFISANDLTFDEVFLVAFSLPLVFYLVALVVFIFTRVRSVRRQDYWPGSN